MFLSNLNFSFSIICFSETWLNDSNVDNSNYELPNYVSVHQIRNHYKGGGVSVYIHKNFEFKIRNDLSINSKDIESIGVEFISNKHIYKHLNFMHKFINNQIPSVHIPNSCFMLKIKYGYQVFLCIVLL